MAPHFRQNDFYGGLAAGISAIQAAIDKEALPGPERKAGNAAASALNDWLPVLFPLAIVVFFFLSAILRRRGRGPQIVTGRRGWPTTTAGGLGGLGGMRLDAAEGGGVWRLRRWRWRRRFSGGGGGGFDGGGGLG